MKLIETIDNQNNVLFSWTEMRNIKPQFSAEVERFVAHLLHLHIQQYHLSDASKYDFRQRLDQSPHRLLHHYLLHHSRQKISMYTIFFYQFHFITQ